jgi:hypothetical protein
MRRIMDVLARYFNIYLQNWITFRPFGFQPSLGDLIKTTGQSEILLSWSQ